MALRRVQRQSNGSRKNGNTSKSSTTLISSKVPQFTVRHRTANGEVGSEQRQKGAGKSATNIAGSITTTMDARPPPVAVDDTADLPSEPVDSPNYDATADYAAESGHKPREVRIALTFWCATY